MKNPTKRGTAPGRARDADELSGSFQRGHEKRGGRKPGTPNVFSLAYKKLIVEAAYRVGEDGNGRDGVVGYLTFIAEYHPEIFVKLLMNLIPPEPADEDADETPPWTMEDLNLALGEYIQLRERTKERAVKLESNSAWSWTGQPFPLSSLMHTAVFDPKSFCELFGAAFLRPSTRRRRRWPKARTAR